MEETDAASNFIPVTGKMNISDIAIVIPVHRARLTPDEQISVMQCGRILGHYMIRFAAPQSVRAIEGFEHIAVEHFADEYFQSVASYNRLMMSSAFYERFAEYSYILIYQPDAFVFRDELLQWAQTGYSYVGAPWILKAKYRTWWGQIILRLRGMKYRLRNEPFRPLLLGDKTGNGGFSLRKTADFIRVCNTEQAAIEEYIQKCGRWSEFNEDAFWATRTDFHYPDVQTALGFAFDIYPEECLKQTGHALPFGCHGWCKENVDAFWRPVIERQAGIKPLRVYMDYQAFIHQTFGGVSRYFTEIIARLPKYGIEPTVGVRYSNNTHLRALQIAVEPVKNRKIAKRLNRRYCRQDIAAGQFDLIHATYFDPYVLAANKLHRPLVITIHDMIDEVMHEGHMTPRRKALLAKHATHIIAVSEHTKKDVMQILHIADDKISVVYHGSSVTAVEPQQIPDLPERYVLYVGGRQRKYKNFELFLRAMQSVVKEENVEIVCIGSPFTQEENVVIQAYGLQQCVHSLFAEDDQLYYIYHHAQCFVYPSCYEGFGLPILEAWSAACPLLLSRSSCFPEIAGDAAAYFEENNADDLAKKTLHLLRSVEARKELIERGEARLMNYSWDKAAEKIACVYRQIYSRYV